MAENSILTFPYDDSKDRLERYAFNDELFEGKHFDAFAMKVNSEQYTKDYMKLKYIVGNFAGMISKVCADMLFSDNPNFTVDADDSEDTQTFIDALIFQNKLHTQNYESALANSRHGDALYKIRIGKLNPGDEDSTVIIEDITPKIYFPRLSQDNTRQEPDVKELAWTFERNNKKYLRKEIHQPGLIENQLFLMEGDRIQQQVDIKLFDDSLEEFVETGINRSLIIHVPNWRDGGRYFGYDDYSDLTSLFYALNNRMTKTENILDKHSDPILALPEGVLNERGQVRKEAFHMFEIPNGGIGQAAKPEYIVWNASLDANFKHIDKLVEMMYMFSETSPDVFGMGQNGNSSASGRALKLRLMRTIAKVARKRLYYDTALKEVIHTAQLLAQANDVGVLNEETGNYDIMATSDAVIPNIEWQDGIPADSLEAAQEEQIRLASGNTSITDSIQRLDHVDEDSAMATLEEIKSEMAVNMPTSSPKPDMLSGDTHSHGAV